MCAHMFVDPETELGTHACKEPSARFTNHWHLAVWLMQNDMTQPTLRLSWLRI